MKNKRFYRMLLSLAAVMLCMTAFSIPAYAGGTEPAEQPETEQPQAVSYTHLTLPTKLEV